MHSRKTTKDVLIGVMFAAAIVSGLFMTGSSGTGQYALPGPNTSQAQNVALPTLPKGLGVVGMVASISGQSITLGNFTVIPAATPNTAASSESIIITVDSSTILELITPKDTATVTKERDAFIALLEKLQTEGKLSTSTPPAPPEPYITKKLTLSDFKVGDTITAFAGRDISKATTFTATKINIFNALSMTPPRPTATSTKSH